MRETERFIISAKRSAHHGVAFPAPPFGQWTIGPPTGTGLTIGMPPSKPLDEHPEVEWYEWGGRRNLCAYSPTMTAWEFQLKMNDTRRMPNLAGTEYLALRNSEGDYICQLSSWEGAVGFGRDEGIASFIGVRGGPRGWPYQ